MKSIAFIDIFGLPYDGDTLSRRGLGGSESAVIQISRELAQLGYDVKVFNDCTRDDCNPGVYHDVTYIPLSDVINYTEGFDVMISSRTVAPFAPNAIKDRFKTFTVMPDFENISKASRYRVLWMHDTFCDGDDLIEGMCLDGLIHKVFTLSDFHTTYVTNCNHGKRRNFEVMKKYIFQTRNAITKYGDEWVDVNTKDPNLFVFNSSVTKGMRSLVERIWPRVKECLPEAKLAILGGYYKFGDNDAMDEQQQTYENLKSHAENNPALDIHFTGIVTPPEVAMWMRRSNFMLYPGEFPETYGISVLEALSYNTPVICNIFGALEEIAIDQACWKTPYAIQANGLFPNIVGADQEDRFINLAIEAYNNTYLHQQKQYSCNQLAGINTWDTVALQWKQHFCAELKFDYLSKSEYQRVSEINQRVKQIFGTRFSNPHHNPVARQKQQHIDVVIPFYNATKFLPLCLKSIFAQDYDNYTIHLINDASTDNPLEIIDDILKIHRPGCKLKVYDNQENLGAVRNQVELINKLDPENIVILVDGDDWLYPDPEIFNKINNLYHADCEFSYGSCWSLVDGIPLIAQPYPPNIQQSKQYRSHRFAWNMPYTHLRTFRARMLHIYKDSTYQDANGKWLKAGGDTALFYAALEAAHPDKVVCVPDLWYVYNDAHSGNDYKINSEEQTKNANYVLNHRAQWLDKPKVYPSTKKRVLIAIPTARNIEVDTFKSIYDQIVDDNVEIDFQYFYGYRVDQIRNLIADWVIKGNYDYLFSVDSDITFDNNILQKFIDHDLDIVSGIYRQRKEDLILEIYAEHGGNVSWEEIKNKQLVKIGACGFGCVLVKRQVFESVGQPAFEYHVALDHKNTVSEDWDFCAKARDKGFEVWADTDVVCGHIGSTTFKVS